VAKMVWQRATSSREVLTIIVRRKKDGAKRCRWSTNDGTSVPGQCNLLVCPRNLLEVFNLGTIQLGSEILVQPAHGCHDCMIGIPRYRGLVQTTCQLRYGHVASLKEDV
jgi:hypothetical protein